MGQAGKSKDVRLFIIIEINRLMAFIHSRPYPTTDSSFPIVPRVLILSAREITCG